jgi:hypothetical protein
MSAQCTNCNNTAIVQNLGAQYNNQVYGICKSRDSQTQCTAAGGTWGTTPSCDSTSTPMTNWKSYSGKSLCEKAGTEFTCMDNWSGGTPVKCMGNGQVACASNDAKSCLWGTCGANGSNTGASGGSNPLIINCGTTGAWIRPSDGKSTCEILTAAQPAPAFKGGAVCAAEGDTTNGYIKDFFDETGTRQLPPSACKSKCSETDGCNFYSTRMNDYGGCMLFSSCDNPTSAGGLNAYNTYAMHMQDTSSNGGASSNGWSKMISPGGTVAYNIGKPSCDSGAFWNIPQGDCAYAACPQGTKAQWVDGASDNPSIQVPSNIPSCLCKSTNVSPSSMNISAPQPNTACDSDQVVTKGQPDSDGTGNITTYLNPEGMKIYSADISNIFSTDFYDGRIYFYAEQPTGQNLTADPINKRGTDSNGTLYLYTNLNPQGLRIRSSAASCFSTATSVYLGGPARNPPTKTKTPAGPQTLQCPSLYPHLLPNPSGTTSNYFCYKSINGNSGDSGDGLCNCNCANCGYNPAYANCPDLGSQCATSVPGNPNNVSGILTGNELVDTCSESQSATLPIQPPLTSEFTSLHQTYLGPAPQNVLMDSANTISQRLADISTSRTSLYDKRHGNRNTFDQTLPKYKNAYEKLQAQDTKTNTLWAMEEETKLYNASERIKYVTWATAAITLSAVFLHGLAK